MHVGYYVIINRVGLSIPSEKTLVYVEKFAGCVFFVLENQICHRPVLPLFPRNQKKIMLCNHHLGGVSTVLLAIKEFFVINKQIVKFLVFFTVQPS